MSEEFYKKFRPSSLQGIVGNEQAVAQLRAMEESGNFPSFVLFVGPSGCGKTTLARIYLNALVGVHRHDMVEMNSDHFTGVDMVRTIISRMGLRPAMGEHRAWLLDEAHMQTKQSQEAWLKPLEDTPSHVKFVFCTTEVNKISTALKNRATIIRVDSLTVSELEVLAKRTLKKLKRKDALSEEVLDKLCETSEGSSRKLLVKLQQVLSTDDPDRQLEILDGDDQYEMVGYDIAKLLINPKTKWNQIASVLKQFQGDPEGLRRVILGFAKTSMLSGNNSAQGYMLAEFFSDNTYNTGMAGIVMAAYGMYHSK